MPIPFCDAILLSAPDERYEVLSEARVGGKYSGNLGLEIDKYSDIKHKLFSILTSWILAYRAIMSHILRPKECHR